MKIIFFAILLVIICACDAHNMDNNYFKENQLCTSKNYTEKTLLKNDTLLNLPDSISVFLEKNCSLWLQSWQESLEISYFKQVELNAGSTFGSNKWSSWEITPTFFEVYHEMLVYSPDKSQCIDLYSYKIALYKKNNLTYATCDVDTKVFILDVINKKSKLLVSSGSMEQYDDCFWFSDHTLLFLVVRSEFTSEGEMFRPLIIIYDLLHDVYKEYQYRQVLDQLNYTYIKQKFPNVIFDF